MQTETALILKPASLPVSEEDYRQWIRRFDELWSSATSERDQREMQVLLQLIEQYETICMPNRSTFNNTRTQGDIS
jgi:hypothetical protein